MEKFFAFFNRLILRRGKRVIRIMIMVIALLCCFVWVCTVEAMPSAPETSPAPPWDEMDECFDCGLQCNETRLEKGINVIRPINRDWIDGTKLCKNCFSEYLASGDSSFVAVMPKIQQKESASSSNGKQPEISSGEIKAEEIHPSFYLWIAIMFAEASGLNRWIVRSIPNVK